MPLRTQICGHSLRLHFNDPVARPTLSMKGAEQQTANTEQQTINKTSRVKKRRQCRYSPNLSSAVCRWPGGQQIGWRPPILIILSGSSSHGLKCSIFGGQVVVCRRRRKGTVVQDARKAAPLPSMSYPSRCARPSYSRRMSRFGVVVVAALCLLAGCSIGAREVSPSPTGVSTAPKTSTPALTIAPFASLDCAAAIDTVPKPQEGYEVVLGVVALPTAAVTEALQTTRTDGPPARYFAKRGLLTSGSFELAVVGPSALDGAVGWGSFSRFARALSVPDCHKNSSTWQVYAGGFETSKTGCLTVRVTTATHSEDVQIGVGASCPGQKPPPEPSDN